MSNPGDHGSWNSQEDDHDAQHGAQDPIAQPAQDPDGRQGPYGQDPAGQQQYGQQDPYGHGTSAQAPYGQDPYGQASSASDPYGQSAYGQPALGQDPFARNASAQDPFGQPSSAADPFGQEQQSWAPAPGSGASASDPFGQGAAGYGTPGAGQGPAFGTGGPMPQGAPQSRVLVGLLGIFLGGFGVHRFLLGYTTIGIIQIVVTVLTCGVGALWGFVEGIMVLAKSPSFERDAHGRPLAD